MPSLNKKKNGNGKVLWRSLEERADSPEFRKWVEAEFPAAADALRSPVSRRNFLKVMGASMALAGLAGCRYPVEEIVPHASRPEGTSPGVTREFATAYEVAGVGVPVLATSCDGRPIKVDGNPEHPLSLGGSSAMTQAGILELYDPDRGTRPVRDGVATDWAAFEAFAGEHFGKLEEVKGAGLAVVAEPSRSPTLLRMKKRFLGAFPRARWVEYAPFARHAGHRAVPLLEKADVIVCLDDDLLYDHPTAMKNARDFAAGRKATGGKMKRLHVVEADLSVTGSNADHRYPVRSDRIRAFADELLKNGTSSSDPDVRQVAEDLDSHRGRALVTASDDLADHAFLLNREYGAVGNTVLYYAEEDRDRDLAALADEMAEGKVETLVTIGGNPAFDGPRGFAPAMAAVGTRIRLSLYEDETAAACNWYLPMAHWLEAWGDVRTWDGTPSVTQPLIRPLYEGRTAAELAALLLGDKVRKGYELTRETWKPILFGRDFEKAWRKVVHDGFHAAAGENPVTPPTGSPPAPGADAGEGIVVTIGKDRRIHDGRYANLGWLQEMPDPVTKLTWDNAALLSPATAEKLDVATGDHLRIAGGGAEVVIPAFVQPGIAAGNVVLSAGSGRTKGGRVADGAGTDVYPLLGKSGLTVAKVSGHTRMASTQDHHAIDAVGAREVERRMHALVREASLEHYREHPDFAKHAVHHPPLKSLWEERKYEKGPQWGMMIDLSACTGCSACVVACQAENNIPVVGKKEVLTGREMQWIRVDRYYGGEPDAPSVSHQPVPCMQCENAPCEQVCPVAATMHSEEGLNDMVYNRCIGTRYCSNNCPYKVRRFNWFTNHQGLTQISKMKFNPDVTVRSRGVMEKCTYCVQRISAARVTAKREGRPVRDGEVTPACAQACPSGAIVFGDLRDIGSRVAKEAEDPRAYGILEELNVKPRTRYLARLTNPRHEKA